MAVCNPSRFTLQLFCNSIWASICKILESLNSFISRRRTVPNTAECAGESALSNMGLEDRATSPCFVACSSSRRMGSVQPDRCTRTRSPYALVAGFALLPLLAFGFEPWEYPIGMLDKTWDFGGTCLALASDPPGASDPVESSADVTRTAANESSWGACWGSNATLPLSPAPTTGTTAVSIIHSVLLRIQRGDTRVITTGYVHCDEVWYRDRKISLGIRCVSLLRRMESR
mmetsp:Transcript_12140/g.34400  ORF Transcript_12140/g.34400 Transcript_12140/m.34400 type:complete len:230 (-) Transcript_12140:740-1429(-)